MIEDKCFPKNVEVNTQKYLYWHSQTRLTMFLKNETLESEPLQNRLLHFVRVKSSHCLVFIYRNTGVSLCLRLTPRWDQIFRKSVSDSYLQSLTMKRRFISWNNVRELDESANLSIKKQLRSWFLMHTLTSSGVCIDEIKVGPWKICRILKNKILNHQKDDYFKFLEAI